VARPRTDRGVKLAPGGLRLKDGLLPLLAGSVHYWRLPPDRWKKCLTAVRDLGMGLVDVYVPWGVHEVAPGVLELGKEDPQRDVAAFLRLAHELGLYAIVRPGPHINAELTYFGIPERVVWDASCQARSAAQAPVMLPMVPLAFPVPSYASAAFMDEVARYFRLLGPVLSPLLYPDGPIVMLQVDNEGALYFRDGAYDQDYHPDAITLYRDFLRDKYRTPEALTSAYRASGPRIVQSTIMPPPVESTRSPAAESKNSASLVATATASEADEELRFARILPPTRFAAATPEQLTPHLDWAEFHEHLLATAFGRFADALADAGLEGVPTTHNFPLAQETTPLNAARVSHAVDLVGLDYYHGASEHHRAVIARRTSELAVRTEARSQPAFACEMVAGFPPFFPPLDEHDSEFTVLAAMAYGLRGFNAYMAVERDRWIGAPIDAHGRPRPFAAFWKRLSVAMERTSFHRLRRVTPVRLLTPRSDRRLARVMHAFGPLTAASFSVAGSGAKDACLEDELGLGYSPALVFDAFSRTVEEALEQRGVPFAHIGGEDRDVSIDGAKWVICATSGMMSPKLALRLQQARDEGIRITLGPTAAAERIASLGSAVESVLGSRIPGTLEDFPAEADAAVSKAIEELALPTYACDPSSIHATVHEDIEGTPRVLFVLNGGDDDVNARVTIDPRAGAAIDLFDESNVRVEHGRVELRMRPRSVRMFALSLH